MTTFFIAQLERTLPDGIVTVVHWTASKTDGDHSASTYASLALTAKNYQILDIRLARSYYR